jgi:drug/metabolite transporter (DMT)-like permease
MVETSSLGSSKRRRHPLTSSCAGTDELQKLQQRATDKGSPLSKEIRLALGQRSYTSSMSDTLLAAGAYIGSGICQPLLMQVCKMSGLADARAQLYMLAYYAGPACLIFTLRRRNSGVENSFDGDVFPSVKLVSRAAMIAVLDIAAQSLNYTGAGLAGATIFAVVYSSVTVWTAVFSYALLKRSLSWWQWMAVLIVFGGLCITASDSLNLGPDVILGTILISFGSCMHGGTYVLSEALMVGAEQLSPRQNAAIQGMVACVGFSLWQIFYTLPRWDKLIRDPMHTAGTSVPEALMIMAGFSLANLIHSFSFYYTLKNYPGGSTSAGVMKGLQAVLVFAVAHIVFCRRQGGKDMCFSMPKFASLVTVVGGVILFNIAAGSGRGGLKTDKWVAKSVEYTRIQSEADVSDDAGSVVV